MPSVIGQYASFTCVVSNNIIKSILKLNSTVVLYLFTKKLNCSLFLLNFVINSYD